MPVIQKVEKKKEAQSDAAPLNGEKVGKTSKSTVEFDTLESILINLTLSSKSAASVRQRQASTSKQSDELLLPEPKQKPLSTPTSQSPVPTQQLPPKDAQARCLKAPDESFLIKGMPLSLHHPFRIQKDDVVLGPVNYPMHRYSTVTPGTDKGYFARLRYQAVRFNSEDTNKLLVLSLNGDLGVKVAKGEFLPRPFLGSLMEYITARCDIGSSKEVGDPAYSVFVWSAMVPHNVQPCVDALIRPWKSSVAGVWDRTQLNLDKSQYWEHPPVWKDLNKVFNHFNQRAKTYRPPAASARGLQFTPDVDNTIMVEESAFKAHLQPCNHLPIKEYTLHDEERSTEACYRYDRRSGRIQVGGNRKSKSTALLLQEIFQHDSFEFYKEYVENESNQRESEVTMAIDAILLGLIGILSEMENVSSVPVWLAAGGLTPDVSHTFTKEIASNGWEHVIRLDSGEEAFPGRLALEAHVLPKAALPGSEGYISWFDSRLHVLYWIRRGLRALELKGIKVEHGMR
ncbi:hypothetical protein QFC21_003817 [Naganishia friedmannii]|uniref:Uncharacterized protein n=1 Tax=Naganishia friedmannii TaxID=89922 RepID=A0ACC2VKK8_9TREE|nr:hypothetical protein QFC21_003817 [Naganishia friedmannii]